MSDIGLSSSIYHQVRKWAEEVDTVLISLKSGLRQNPSLEEKLGHLLLDLASETYQQPQTRFLVLQLQRKIEIPPTLLKATGQKILSNNIDDSVIQVLEKIALALEQEQALAMARMHRWAR
jgi:hypothetical protein